MAKKKSIFEFWLVEMLWWGYIIRQETKKPSNQSHKSNNCMQSKVHVYIILCIDRLGQHQVAREEIRTDVAAAVVIHFGRSKWKTKQEMLQQANAVIFKRL